VGCISAGYWAPFDPSRAFIARQGRGHCDRDHPRLRGPDHRYHLERHSDTSSRTRHQHRDLRDVRGREEEVVLDHREAAEGLTLPARVIPDEVPGEIRPGTAPFGAHFSF
jgi:hypothetical protein